MVCLPVTDCSKHSHEIAPSGVENINHYSRLTIVENILRIRKFVSGRQISSLHWADRRLQLHYFTKYEVQLCKIQNGLWSGTRQNSNTYACMYTVHHLKLSVFFIVLKLVRTFCYTKPPSSSSSQNQSMKKVGQARRCTHKQRHPPGYLDPKDNTRFKKTYYSSELACIEPKIDA